MTNELHLATQDAAGAAPVRDQYLLGYQEAEQVRLLGQAERLTGEAAWLFDRVGPLDGKQVVELGCGPRGSLDALSERVGPTGSAVGVDRSADAVELARGLVADRGLSNVDVVLGDARSTGLPDAGYDLATARLVLVNVPQPEEIVAEAVRLVRPGGTVAFHEADAVSHVCDPPLEALTRLEEVLDRYAELNSIDRHVGRRLPRLLRNAGLVDVRARPIVYIDEPGHPRRYLLSDFVENLRDRLLAARVITRDELGELHGALKRHLAKPDTTVISHLYVQAWGRKPG
jgi:SAM-dependent methyltransferase